jgi:hypothetical protein
MGEGFVICLACQDDGSIQVLLQNAGQPADGGDSGGESGSDSGGDVGGAGPAGGSAAGGNSGSVQAGDGETVDNIDDALDLAKQLYAQQMQQESGDSGDSGGAGDDGDGDEPMAPADAKSLWNRLAAKKDAQRNAN